MAAPILSLEHLTIRFGGLTAVSDLSCHVDHGAIHSMIGPNGAGKTTVFNAITGIYEPTSGSIKFEGRQLRRPFGVKVLAACLFVGLLTAAAAFLATVGVERLWHAAIKRNYGAGREQFTYARAWDDARAYFRGDLALERSRSGRWSVVSADGSKGFGVTGDRASADALREKLALVLENGGDVRREGTGWGVFAAGRPPPAAQFTSEADARDLVRRLDEWNVERRARQRNSIAALVAGFLLGASGALAVWNRARRAPEVIARSGIARTFQNIRLFANMTVAENVLTALDSGSRTSVLGMALRTTAARRQEAGRNQRVRELLELVGLARHVNLAAKNLAYGDQRRLEIARALATSPRLLLLDEPAAGMNPAEAFTLVRLIEAIRRRGVTVLLIEHHMKVVMGISDRVVVLDYGSKIAEGAPTEVKNDPAVVKAYLGSEEVS